MHHPKLKDEHRFNSSLLDENDRAKVEDIERHVTKLFECATDQQLAIIQDIEKLLNKLAGFKLSFEQKSFRRKMIANLIASAESTELELLCGTKPYAPLTDDAQRDATVQSILALESIPSRNMLMTALYRYFAAQEKEAHAIQNRIATIEKVIANTMHPDDEMSAQIIRSHFKFKQEKGYSFSIGADRRLLKISRKGNGPKFSVLYLYESNTNNSPCKFVLYNGKTHYLGTGSYGKVKLAQEYDQHKWYAIKVQSTLYKGASNLANIDNEVENLNLFGLLKATNLIPYKGKHYTAMQLITGCDAFDAVNENLQNPAKLLRILLAIAKELQKFHDKGTIHRDIKFENFMYDENNDSCQIVDLQFVLRGQGDEQFFDSTFLGTPDYIAPEVLNATQSNGPYPYSKRSDLYAFGFMLQIIAVEHKATPYNCAFRTLLKSFGDELVQPFDMRPRNLHAFIDAANNLLMFQKATKNNLLRFSSPTKKREPLPEPTLVGSSPSKRLYLSPRKI